MDDDGLTVFIYIKGVSKPNPGPSAWGAVLRYKAINKEFGGKLEDMTSVRAEIEASMYAMDQLTRSCIVVIHSNLQFFVQKMANNTSTWTEKNGDLYAALEDYKRLHTIHWRWIKKGEHEAMNRANEIALGYLRGDK